MVSRLTSRPTFQRKPILGLSPNFREPSSYCITQSVAIIMWSLRTCYCIYKHIIKANYTLLLMIIVILLEFYYQFRTGRTLLRALLN